MKNRTVRISQLAAIIVSVMIIVCMALIPPIFSEKKLKAIERSADYAIEHIKDVEELRRSAQSMEKELKSFDRLLHFLYPHDVVTDLERATHSAVCMTIKTPDEESQILAEL